MTRKILFAFWLILFAPLSLLNAQDGAPDSENGIAEPATAETSIVGRINSPGARLSVFAPEQLLQRAQKAESATAEPVSGDDEYGEESESGDQASARQKGSKGVGYRVQVFADNNVKSAKTEARQRERAVKQAFPSYGTYVAYVSPYWRLRVGDFRTQYDAEKAASEIRKAFPRYAREVRVVRDRVNVH